MVGYCGLARFRTQRNVQWTFCLAQDLTEAKPQWPDVGRQGILVEMRSAFVLFVRNSCAWLTLLEHLAILTKVHARIRCQRQPVLRRASVKA